jgi:hypothetical protein
MDRRKKEDGKRTTEVLLGYKNINGVRISF